MFSEVIDILQRKDCPKYVIKRFEAGTKQKFQPLLNTKITSLFACNIYLKNIHFFCSRKERRKTIKNSFFYIHDLHSLIN